MIEQINWALLNDLKPKDFVQRIEMVLNMYAKLQNKADKLVNNNKKSF